MFYWGLRLGDKVKSVYLAFRNGWQQRRFKSTTITYTSPLANNRGRIVSRDYRYEMNPSRYKYNLGLIS